MIQTHWFVRLVAKFGMLLLFIPLFAVVVASFLPSWIAPGQDLSRFGAYQILFQDPELWEPAWRSLWIAVFTACAATGLGTLAAIAIHEKDFKGKSFIHSLLLFPLIFPEIVFGITALIWFLILRLTLGNMSLLLAHITFTLSYAMVTVSARLQNFDGSLEEAAADLGATAAQTFFYVKLPLLAPGIIAAALMSFALSFDDFLVSFFVSGVGTDTLPIRLYSMIKLGLNPAVYSLSAMVLVTTIVALALSEWLSRRART